MDAVRDAWNGLDDAVSTSIAIAVVLIAAVVVERIYVRVLRRAYWRRVDRVAEARGVEELSRLKRQKTLVTSLESLLRYGVYGTAIVISIGLATGGRASALLGASVIAVLVGFGLQRLLGDVVAGALLLFEGHFAVGDVVTVHQHNITGVVEEFSLRTTSLRTFGGDRVTIMNGGMVSFTRWSYGQRQHRLELIVRGEGAVERIGDLCASEGASSVALWIRPPAIDSTEQLGDGLVRVLVGVVEAPGQQELVDRLEALLAAVVGDEALVGPVTSLPLYQPTFDAWRTGLLLRD
jgi:hypothetical protein